MVWPTFGGKIQEAGQPSLSRSVRIPTIGPLLREYLDRGVKGHIPQDFYACFAFHHALKETGSMLNTDFSKYPRM